MENKATEFKATAKEWKDLSSKTFHQVNKALGTKGRIMVILGILIIWLLGAVVAHMGDRYDRDFDRNYGNMMQGRSYMMGDARRGDSQFQERKFRNTQGIQGCNQKAVLEIDPNSKSIRSQANCPFADQANDIQKSEGVFDGLERRIQQMFGSDQKGAQQDISVQNTGVVELATGTAN